MKLNLYNTLSGAKEEFKPIKAGVVGMYHCGPTVYNFAHIGNLRSYVFADTLRRTLEYAGFRVRQVMNITDIGHLTSDADEGDDKMVRALKREGRPMTLEGLRDVAEKYTNAFIEDLKSLNIKLPHDMPRERELWSIERNGQRATLPSGNSQKAASAGRVRGVVGFPAGILNALP